MSLQEIVPFFSCQVSSEEGLKEAIEKGYGEIYIISKAGLFRRTNLTHGRHITVPCGEIPGVKLPEAKMEVGGFFPAGKVPKRLLHEIVAFFKAVMKDNNGANLEAQAFVIWNPQLGYHIRIPEQTVSAASVNFSWDNFLGPEDVVVVDIHSHNQMNAFFSGTDDRDDTGKVTISGVVGKLSTTCEMVFRFNLPGSMKINDLKVSDIFAEEGEQVEVPQEWLNQVKRELPRVQTYNNLYGGGGNRGLHTGKVVGNPSWNGGGTGTGTKLPALSKDQEGLLSQFGFPFANDEQEGEFRPFARRPKKGGTKKGRTSRLPTVRK